MAVLDHLRAECDSKITLVNQRQWPGNSFWASRRESIDSSARRQMASTETISFQRAARRARDSARARAVSALLLPEPLSSVVGQVPNYTCVQIDVHFVDM